MPRIICGANELDDANLTGKSVDESKSELKDVLNVPEGALVRLNGEEVGARNVSLREDDELEFVKPAGSKG